MPATAGESNTLKASISCESRATTSGCWAASIVLLTGVGLQIEQQEAVPIELGLGEGLEHGWVTALRKHQLPLAVAHRTDFVVLIAEGKP